MELNKLSNEAYNAYVQRKAKALPHGEEHGVGFSGGGDVCVIGQGAAGLVPDDGTVPGAGGHGGFRYPDFPHGAAHRDWGV